MQFKKTSLDGDVLKYKKNLVFDELRKFRGINLFLYSDLYK